MHVVIDDNAGFCFGVVKAIAVAEQELATSKTLYCLGDIVHNNAEVRRLAAKGLHVIDNLQFADLHDSRVLIRAHGEPPATYEHAVRHNIELVDATCPMVLTLQKKVRQGYDEMHRVGGQVVIFGKPGHAEVIGLNGQADNSAIIVNAADDLDRIDFTAPIRLFSQTTKSREEYDKLIANIRIRLTDGADFVVHNTICNRVANRTKELETFANGVDLLLFVSGKNSSNGQYLFEYCQKVQPNTRFLSDITELDESWLADAECVGITGATSTPRWLMEELERKINSLRA